MQHETETEISISISFKAQNQEYNDWSSFNVASARKSSRRRKTAFSINRGGFLTTKRKSLRSIHFENNAFDEERLSIPDNFRDNREIIPKQRESTLNAALREHFIPSLSSKVDKKPKDGNFAWID